jgi:hypothetical protein
MPSLRKLLRAAIVTGMILLAVFGSLPATSCYCADGHLKLFCAGHYASAQAPAGKSEHSGCCQCGQNADSADSGGDCCHANKPGKPCGKCCKEISKSLTTTVASVSMPALDSHVFAVLPTEVVVPHAFLSLRNAQLERIESGPPVDLVIVLRTLLI